MPFHHGTLTGASRSPEANTIGRCARRWKRTCASLSVISTVAIVFQPVHVEDSLQTWDQTAQRTALTLTDIDNRLRPILHDQLVGAAQIGTHFGDLIEVDECRAMRSEERPPRQALLQLAHGVVDTVGIRRGIRAEQTPVHAKEADVRGLDQRDAVALARNDPLQCGPAMQNFPDLGLLRDPLLLESLDPPS